MSFFERKLRVLISVALASCTLISVSGPALGGGLYLNGAPNGDQQGADSIFAGREEATQLQASQMIQRCYHLRDQRVQLGVRRAVLLQSRQWSQEELRVIERSFSESERRLNQQMRPCAQYSGF